MDSIIESMQDVSNVISSAPPTATVSLDPFNKVTVCDAYLWKGKYYLTVENRRRAHLHAILEAHNIDNASKIIDILIHEIEAIHSSNPVVAWKCSDGNIFPSKDAGDNYQKLLDEKDTLRKLLSKYGK